MSGKNTKREVIFLEESSRWKECLYFILWGTKWKRRTPLWRRLKRSRKLLGDDQFFEGFRSVVGFCILALSVTVVLIISAVLLNRSFSYSAPWMGIGLFIMLGWIPYFLWIVAVNEIRVFFADYDD